MNLLEKYTDEQISELAENLQSEVAARQRRKAEEQAKRDALPKVSISVNHLEGCWRHGCQSSSKVAMVSKYITNSGSIIYYWAMLKAQWGAAVIMLRDAGGSCSVVDSIPEIARELVPHRK